MRRRGALLLRMPALLTAGLSGAVWSLFHPALMSADSVLQYTQAVSGRFNSWHPPLMSIALSEVLAAGGSLGLLMLAQCLAGALGVWAFSSACLEVLFGERLSTARRGWIAFGVLLLLLIPASPLVFYLMTFWKDAWAMVFLLWLGVLALRLAARQHPSAALLSGIVLLGAALGMVRHNAVVALPFLGLFLWLELRWRALRWAPLFLAAPLAAFLVLNSLLDRAFDVDDQSPGDWILAFDLTGVCARSAEACARLPFTHGRIRDPAALRAGYRPGDLGSVFWTNPPLADPAMAAREHRPELHADYRRALAVCPGLLVRLKLAAFWALLGTRQTYYFFHDSVAANEYGLALPEWSAGIRGRLSRTAGRIAGSPWRWLWGVHLVWLLANLAWIAGLLLGARRRGGPRLRPLALFLLVPLGYAVSYLPATPVPDFRFLYPASLVVQCLTAAGALGALSSRSRTT